MGAGRWMRTWGGRDNVIDFFGPAGFCINGTACKVRGVSLVTYTQIRDTETYQVDGNRP
jgi:hypothetical protein